MENQKMTVVKLRKMYGNGSPLPYAPIFDYFATRERNRNNTTVDALLKSLMTVGIHTTRTAIIQFFRDLQATEVGVFKIGRLGQVSRFVWNVPLRDVALAAQGKIQSFEPEKPAEPAQPLKIAKSEPTKLHPHNLQLGTGNRAVLQLPEKPTGQEIDEILDYLSTLVA